MLKKGARGESNFIAVDITNDENKVILVNIYGRNSDQSGLNENVKNIFLELDNKYYILCGDFNLVPNPDIYTCIYRYNSINNLKVRNFLKLRIVCS